MHRWSTKKDKFEPYLINLGNSLDLSAFVASLDANKAELQIHTIDIKEFLTELGRSEDIRNRFGREFYNLWFEFEIMDYGKMKERLDARELDDFPKGEKEQILFLGKVLQIVPSYL